MAQTLNFDIFKIWGDKERTQFIDYCQKCLVKPQSASLVFGEELSDLNYVLYEICSKCVHGKFTVESVISAITSIVHLHKEIPSLVADILSLLDTESQCIETPGVRDRFCNLLRLCNGKVIPEFILKERLEFDTLGEAGIIKLLKNIQTKFIKTKTRLFYKQQKYNLFREEIEGYAKLITELDPGTGQEPNVEYSLEVLQSLIGCFNLDPNRVLDVVLESFECKPKYANFYCQLLLAYFSTSDTVCQVLSFKFAFYQQVEETKTPPSLYCVTAFLLKHDVLKLSQIYSMLTPEDSKILEESKQELESTQSYIKKLNSLSTNALDSKEDDEVTKQARDENQKLGLCAALLDVGDWKHSKQLMRCFPDHYATSHSFISEKLCNLVHVLIDSFYQERAFCLQVKHSEKRQLLSDVQVKPVESYTDLFGDVFEMILALGPHLHINPVLMAKIIRLSKCWILTKTNIPEYGFASISNIIKYSLLPALSLLECNCCMAEELWNLLKLFPYNDRYAFYYYWKTAANTSHPPLMKVKADVLKKLKYIMKRLSKENVKPTGRQIGKLSHSCPGYIFDYILSQIQTWDNLILPVIDSLKYLTSLSYDVLAFCVIEALGNSEKDRMKHDGTSISMWLQSLASFGGSVFKKYPIDIAGLLQHVANQLIAGKSLDLLILKEVVQKMAGIEATEEMTVEQLEAMSGGELLRSEGGYFNQMRNVKKSSQRLKEALLDQDLAIPLCLLMAQQRNCILFHEQENSHIKLVGKLHDQCQDTLVQYGSFLANNLSTEDYANRLPSVPALLSEYSIRADVAFYLSRPSLNHAINSKYEELKKQDKSMKNLSSPQSVAKYLEIVDSIISPIVSSVQTNLTPKVWEDLNPQFYVTFWSLSMYDLNVPTSSYEREINKLKSILSGEENKDAGKKKKERERCDALITKLTDEMKYQQDHCLRVMARLKNEKDNWFQSKAAKTETITHFLQLCMFPRCIFTPVDALYCAKYVHLIHCLKTPNFSTLLCYDRVFCDITYTVSMCTENEANRYGLLLCSMLETVMHWHRDKAIFEKECSNFPGFMTKFKVSAQTGDSAVDHVDYENYRHVCHKWHYKLTKALIKCLDSPDYVQIRNGLLVLRKIAPHFPSITSLGLALERRVDRIKADEKDKRPDIYVLALGYSGVLKARKPSFIPEAEFHLRDTHRTSAGTTVKTEPVIKTEKTDNNIDARKETRSDSKLKSNSDERSTSKRTVTRTEDQNGDRKVIRIKEEKVTSPMRREDKSSKSDSDKADDERRDRREDRHEKVQVKASSDQEESTREVHYRRSTEPVDDERDRKRRRTDAAMKSPRVDDRETRSLDKASDERNGSRDKGDKAQKEPKPTDRAKPKEKKNSRKREHSDDTSDAPRRRRVKTEEEDSAKRSVDSDRDVRSRREEKSPVVYSSSERRVEREDKKHHRSSSASSGTKKRS